MARVRFRFTINIVTIGVYIQYIVTNHKIFLSNDTFMVTFDLLKLTHKKDTKNVVKRMNVLCKACTLTRHALYTFKHQVQLLKFYTLNLD